jgi:predicted lipoprotein with Yx(FWY)xxD motif
MTRIRLFSPLLLVALVAAGCGSSSSKSSSSTSTSAAATQTKPAAAPLTITTKHASKLGTILAAGPKHLTVYLFEADTASKSNCTGKCAVVWPPVVGTAIASGKARAGDLGTITRPGGITQVTYKGHPLYYFINDKDNGDAYGAGIVSFGAKWYSLMPSGNKVDNT